MYKRTLLSVMAALLLLTFSCDEMGSAGGDSEVAMVEAEFINPTADTLYAKMFDHEGWIENIAVAPFSSVVKQVEEGLYTVGAVGIDGKMINYLPKGMDPEALRDTINFGVTTNPEDGSKSVRYNFNNRLYKNLYIARHAFDLSFDERNTYAVADIQWMYGVEDEKSMRDEFMKVTNEGKKFILSVHQGNMPILLPEKVSGPFKSIPEVITVQYKNQVFPKVFMMPDSVPASESANHLVRELILN